MPLFNASNKPARTFTAARNALDITSAHAAEPGLIGGEAVIFSTPVNDVYPCGNLSGKDTGTNSTGAVYDQWKHPFFDGPAAPISFKNGTTTMLRFNVSSYKNYQMLSTLTNGTIGSGAITCTPSLTSALSAYNNAFTWKEWLYGIFRDVPSGKVYSVIYNEYYGGNYRAASTVAQIGTVRWGSPRRRITVLRSRDWHPRVATFS